MLNNIENLAQVLLNGEAIPVEPAPIQGRPALEIITKFNVDSVGEQLARYFTDRGLSGEISFDEINSKLVFKRINQ